MEHLNELKRKRYAMRYHIKNLHNNTQLSLARRGFFIGRYTTETSHHTEASLHTLRFPFFLKNVVQYLSFLPPFLPPMGALRGEGRMKGGMVFKLRLLGRMEGGNRSAHQAWEDGARRFANPD